MKKVNFCWLIDLGMFCAFILSFFLEATGVDLHQWLGMGLGAAILVHLVSHWGWVVSVTERLFKLSFNRNLLYYLIDGLMLLGFGAILASGLLISTWLNLPLANYGVWKTLHVLASIGTLAALVLKIGLHWRWIVCTTRKIFSRPAAAVQPAVRPVLAAAPAAVSTRRDFLKLMGAVSVVSVVAAHEAVEAVRAAAVKEASTSLTAQTAVENAAPAASASPTAQAVAENASPAAVPTSAPAANLATESQACTVRCRRGCSYPGHCRRYTDTNGNNLCDLGECM